MRAYKVKFSNQFTGNMRQSESLDINAADMIIRDGCAGFYDEENRLVCVVPLNSVLFISIGIEVKNREIK